MYGSDNREWGITRYSRSSHADETTMTHHECCDSGDAQPSAERHASSSDCEQDTHACDNCTQHCFAHAGLLSISSNIQVTAYQGVFATPIAQLLDASEGILRPPKA